MIPLSRVERKEMMDRMNDLPVLKEGDLIE
jgi:hypothetical protein